jgi:hypothetical protein
MQLDEYAVKSAFLYNFVQFVDWPTSKLGPTDPLTICVLDDPGIAQHFSPLNARVARGHAIRVRTVPGPADSSACHVLFVAVDDHGHLLALASGSGSTGLLTVGQSSGQRVSDAVIDLVISQERVAFDINLKAAAAQQLTISSKLLRLARHVSGAPGTDLGGSGPGRSH